MLGRGTRSQDLDREEKMDKVQKLVTTGITVGAGILGGKLVDFLWLKATGSKAPRKGTDEAAEASFRKALGFAVVSALVAAIMQTVADRSANKVVAKFTK
jgi:hypothetical protein